LIQRSVPVATRSRAEFCAIDADKAIATLARDTEDVRRRRARSS